tara:strand:- start:301 stop:480 length:180 start_codon:yes stop_codon:yes gene_type:complete
MTWKNEIRKDIELMYDSKNLALRTQAMIRLLSKHYSPKDLDIVILEMMQKIEPTNPMFD